MELASDPPSESEVLHHLDAIERSAPFRNSEKLKKHLRLLVVDTLAGRGHLLNAARVASVVYGADSGFKSSLDSTVRVSSNRLRWALKAYYGEEGATSDIIIRLSPGSYAPEFERRQTDLRSRDERELEALFNTYVLTNSSQDHEVLSRRIADYLAANPEAPEILMIRAILNSDALAQGLSDDESLADKANDDFDTMASLEEPDAEVYFWQGIVALQAGDLERVRSLNTQVLAADGLTPVSLAQFGFLNAVAAGIPLPEPLAEKLEAESDPIPPWMLHYPRCIWEYGQGNLEAALDAAIKIGLPNFYAASLVRAAILGELGLRQAAAAHLDHAHRLQPRALRDPSRFLKPYVPDRDLREAFVAGLQLAGIERFQ